MGEKKKSESSLVSLAMRDRLGCRVVFEEVGTLSGTTGSVGGGVVLCARTDAQCQLPALGGVLGVTERVCLPFDKDPSPFPPF